ncbi:hypothetical protein ACVIIV_000112 [Bradyrhizobium sp. USDA 4354]
MGMMAAVGAQCFASPRVRPAGGEKTGHLPRHCEGLLRRSNPDCLRGEILDCFAALAMTENEDFPSAQPPPHHVAAAIDRIDSLSLIRFHP